MKIKKFGDFILEKDYYYGDTDLPDDFKPGDTYTDQYGEKSVVDPLTEEDLEDFYGREIEEIKKIDDYFIEEEKNEKFKKSTFIDSFTSEIREVSIMFDNVIKEKDEINILFEKLKMLSSPDKIESNLTKIEETQTKLMLFYLLKVFKECSEVYRKPVRGFNFESFVAGLMADVNIVKEDTDPVDLISKKNGYKYQLKFYTYNEKNKNGISIIKMDKIPLIAERIKILINNNNNNNNNNFYRNLKILKKIVLEDMLKCDYYIIALKNDYNDIKIFIIPKDVLLDELSTIFDLEFVNQCVKLRKTKLITKEYKNIKSNVKENILIGGGSTISKVKLLNSVGGWNNDSGRLDIKSIVIKFSDIEGNNKKIQEQFNDYINQFDNYISSLKNNYKKMIFGSNENSPISKRYKESYNSTYNSLEDIKSHINKVSYGKFRLKSSNMSDDSE
jgi:hypothetical protein